MAHLPLVGIVLLNTNQDQFARDCVSSLARGTYPSYQIVIVDNPSRHSLADLPRTDARIIIIENDKHLGFCGGNNAGIAHFLARDADYILILNSDTIVRPDFLETMVSCGESWQKQAVITSKIYYDDNRNMLWYAGGHINYLQGLGKHYGFREIDQGHFETRRRVGYVTGCSMLVPSGIYRSYGLMKEELFIYMDDTEFSMRLQKLGIPIIYEPKAILYHRVGGGRTMIEYSPMYLYHITRNRIYVTDSLIYQTYLFFINLIYSFLRLCFYILKGQKSLKQFQIRAILRGFKDSFRLKRSSFFGYRWN